MLRVWASDVDEQLRGQMHGSMGSPQTLMSTSTSTLTSTSTSTSTRRTVFSIGMAIPTHKSFYLSKAKANGFNIYHDDYNKMEVQSMIDDPSWETPPVTVGMDHGSSSSSSSTTGETFGVPWVWGMGCVARCMASYSLKGGITCTSH